MFPSPQNRNLKIPSMGFTDNYSNKPPSTVTRKSSITPSATKRSPSEDSAASVAFPLNIWDAEDESADKRSLLIPDQEILDSTEEIYFQSDVDTGVYELNVSPAERSNANTYNRESLNCDVFSCACVEIHRQ